MASCLALLRACISTVLVSACPQCKKPSFGECATSPRARAFGGLHGLPKALSPHSSLLHSTTRARVCMCTCTLHAGPREHARCYVL